MAEQFERRQGFRTGAGNWNWLSWQACDETAAQRVSGLMSWQVRRVSVCLTCGGTGRAPDGVREDGNG